MSKSISYRIEVTATLPLTDDPQHPDFYTEAIATSLAFRSQLERAMLATLRRFEAEVTNLEILDFSVEDDGLHGPSCSCDACRAERCMDTAREGER